MIAFALELTNACRAKPEKLEKLRLPKVGL